MIANETRADGQRVVVTGSQGFLGRHVRAALARRGATCIGVDRPGSGAEIEVDLADPAFDPRAVWDAAGPVPTLLYLAANISRTVSVDAPARDNIRVIADASVQLIESGAARGLCRHIVDCSTFKIFGPQRQPKIEPKTHPRRPDPFSYGSAKALGERLLAVASLRSGFRYAMVHSTCIYGPGQHLNNAIPRFLRAALAGDTPVVYGNGGSIRDDVYAPDLADVIIEAGLRQATGSFHGAGERDRTIREVAEACCDAVATLTGTRVTPVHDPSQSPKWWIDQTFDAQPARDFFGYRPTSFVHALTCEAEWLRAGAPKETERFVR
jgi:nucleoside-diphosphate-sugar epimerase